MPDPSPPTTGDVLDWQDYAGKLLRRIAELERDRAKCSSMPIPKMIAEWYKGCSCDGTMGGVDGRKPYPGYCPECTDALVGAIERRAEVLERENDRLSDERLSALEEQLAEVTSQRDIGIGLVCEQGTAKESGKFALRRMRKELTDTERAVAAANEDAARLADVLCARQSRTGEKRSASEWAAIFDFTTAALRLHRERVKETP